MLESKFILKSVLLIGLSNSGKTHYGAQLELRLSIAEGKLKKFTASNDNTLFKDVRNNLIEGLASDHTPTGTNKKTDFSLTNDKNQKFELIWQDYAGEQIREIFERRKVVEKWQLELKESRSWLLLIRIDDIKLKKDLINQTPSKIVSKNSIEESKSEYSDQTVFIELLQLMLFAKGIKKRTLLTIPLSVALTCWDEIDEVKDEISQGNYIKPIEILKLRAPMLFNYIMNNWDPNFLTVIGLSALGMALSKTVPNKEFKKKGPENFGYVILPDGSKSEDLTLPLAFALESLL